VRGVAFRIKELALFELIWISNNLGLIASTATLDYSLLLL